MSDAVLDNMLFLHTYFAKNRPCSFCSEIDIWLFFGCNNCCWQLHSL